MRRPWCPRWRSFNVKIDIPSSFNHINNQIKQVLDHRENKKVYFNFDNSKFTFILQGEWHGLTVSLEDCHSKGRRIESRSSQFFYPNSNSFVRCQSLIQVEKEVNVPKKALIQSRDGRRRRERREESNEPAGVSGMKNTEQRKMVRIKNLIKWSTPSSDE